MAAVFVSADVEIFLEVGVMEELLTLRAFDPVAFRHVVALGAFFERWFFEDSHGQILSSHRGEDNHLFYFWESF